MAALSDAGYVSVRKTGGGPTGRTWYRITRSGRVAYDRHIAALRALVEEAPVAGVPDPDAVT